MTVLIIFVLVRSLPIDTHRLAKRLEEAGFSPAQVEAQLEVLIQMVNLSDLASKADLRRLALRFKKELQLAEARLRKEIAESEGRLRKEIAESEARLRKEVAEKIAESELRLRKEIAESEARLRKEVAEKIAESEARLRAEVEKSELRVRAEIVQSQNRLIFWVAGLLLAQGALYLTLQKLFQLLP